MQILHGLYQLSGDLNGLTWAGTDAGFEDANTYAVAAPEGYVLFDCGCGDTFAQILSNAAYWGIDPKEIGACCLTHAHLDHAGAAWMLKKQGVTMYASRDTADAVAAGDDRCAGYLYHKRFQPVDIDKTLEDGESLQILGLNVYVFHVPGHSRGCTSYLFQHEDKKVLVSGDIIGTLLAGDFGWEGSIDFDKAVYIDSLRRLATLEADIMLPGHGMVYFREPRRRIEQVLNAALMQWR